MDEMKTKEEINKELSEYPSDYLWGVSHPKYFYKSGKRIKCLELFEETGLLQHHPDYTEHTDESWLMILERE